MCRRSFETYILDALRGKEEEGRLHPMKNKAWALSLLLVLILTACSAGQATPLPAAGEVESNQPTATQPTANSANSAPLDLKGTLPPEASGFPPPFEGGLVAALGEGMVTQAAESPDGQLLLVASSDGKVAWQDARSGQELGSLIFSAGDRLAVPEIIFSADSSLFALAAPERVDVVSRERGAVVASYTAQTSPGIMDVVFAGGAQRIVVRESQTYSYGGFGSLVVLNLQDKNLLTLVIPDKPDIFQFSPPAVSPDGQLVAAGMTDGRVLVWEAATGILKVVLGGHKASVTGVAFHPDGELLASIDESGRIRVRQVGDALLVKELASEAGTLTGFMFEDGEHLLVSNDRAPAQRVTLANGSIELVTPTYPAPHALLLERYNAGVMRAGGQETRLIFSADGRLIAVISAIVQIWDVQDARVALVIGAGEGEQARVAAFSPDGSRLVVAYDNRSVRLWDTATGEQVHELRAPSQYGWTVYDVAFSPDGHMIAASDRMEAEVFDADSGQSLVKIGSQKEDEYAVKVAFSDDSRSLFAVLNRGVLEVWNVANSRISRRETIPNGNTDGLIVRGVGWRWPWLAHFTRDAEGPSVEIYNIVTQKTLRLTAPADLGVLAFNQDGSLLFAKTSGMVCIWKTESGELVECGELAAGYGSGFAINAAASLAAFVYGEQVLLWDIQPVVKGK